MTWNGPRGRIPRPRSVPRGRGQRRNRLLLRRVALAVSACGARRGGRQASEWPEHTLRGTKMGAICCNLGRMSE